MSSMISAQIREYLKSIAPSREFQGGRLSYADLRKRTINDNLLPDDIAERIAQLLPNADIKK